VTSHNHHRMAYSRYAIV